MQAPYHVEVARGVNGQTDRVVCIARVTLKGCGASRPNRILPMPLSERDVALWVIERRVLRIGERCECVLPEDHGVHGSRGPTVSDRAHLGVGHQAQRKWLNVARGRVRSAS